MKTYFDPGFIRFFIDLSRNNHREWFQENRERYEQSVKLPFQQFITDLQAELQKTDIQLQAPLPHMIHRINRNLRFSQDKTPYKLKVSAMISPTGKRNKMMPAFYLELNPEKVEIYMGAFFPDTELLLAHRQHIRKNLKTFNALITEKKFKKMYGEMQGEDQKRLPQLFQSALKQQPLLLKKEFYFYASLDIEEIFKKNFLKKVAAYYNEGYPFLKFMRSHIK